MAKKIPVSLWVGQSKRASELEAYLQEEFTEDGDANPSPFIQDFSVKDYNEDRLEAARVKTTKSLSKMLANCSYSDVVIPAFVALVGEDAATSENSFILLYGYNHKKPPSTTPVGKLNMRFLGTIKVEIPGWVD